MTPDDSFDDLAGDRQAPESTDFLRTLQMVYAKSADSRLPENARAAIRTAIVREAQVSIASIDLRKSGGTNHLNVGSEPDRWDCATACFRPRSNMRRSYAEPWLSSRVSLHTTPPQRARRRAEAAWTRSLAQLPSWRSRADGIIHFAGFPLLSDFIRACPGVARGSIPIPAATPTSVRGAGQAPTLRPQNGLLGVRRKIRSHVTRGLLAGRMLRPVMKRLCAARRIGVFSAGQVRYSIAHEFSWLTWIGRKT